MADPRRIRVTIDRLVLRGVRPGDRFAVTRALERSLATALETDGLPGARTLAANALSVKSLNVRLAPTPRSGRALGAAAGKSLHGALARAVAGPEIRGGRP